VKLVRRRDLLIGIGFLLFILCLWLYGYRKELWYKELRIRKIASCLAMYIERNNGQFPSSTKDLVNEGLLNVKKAGNKTSYEVRFDFADTWFRKTADNIKMVGWSIIKDFDEFNIRYGAKIQELELRDGYLYDSKNEKKIFLITGPYESCILRKTYEELSVHLYREMVKFDEVR